MPRPRAFFAAFTGCLLLAGCGSGPSQTQTAAYVGDGTVSIDQVQQLIDKAVQEQPAAQQLAQQHKLDQLGREVVRQLVVHEEITSAARREGLTADPVTVAQEANALDQPVSADATDPSQLPEGIVARARDHTEYATDYELEQRLGAKYFATMSVTFDYTTVSSDDNGPRRDQALAKAEQFAANPAAAANVVRTDAAAGLDASLGTSLPATQSPTFASSVLFGVPAGTVVTFQPDPSQALWVVAVIRQHTVNAAVPAGQSVQPTAGQLASIGTRLLQPDVDTAGVRINPRYGVWDPVAMDLAPSAAETSGIVLPVKGFVRP
ncbi:MAG TPA: hypothetical protein VFG87_10145 [Amycolatopsis sp.]|nr:hypothetical protein [Amycolatopsis sp.]